MSPTIPIPRFTDPEPEEPYSEPAVEPLHRLKGVAGMTPSDVEAELRAQLQEHPSPPLDSSDGGHVPAETGSEAGEVSAAGSFGRRSQKVRPSSRAKIAKSQQEQAIRCRRRRRRPSWYYLLAEITAEREAEEARNPPPPPKPPRASSQHGRKYQWLAEHYHLPEYHAFRCGARTRAGSACKRRPIYPSGRCKFHGGLSTGPKTEQGRRQSAENGRKGGRPRKRPVESETNH